MLLRWPERWAQSRAKLGHLLIPRGSVVEPPIVTELRDVFHTLVDAAGLASGAPSWAQPPFDPTDGKSMLCLLTDPTGTRCEYAPNPGPWRQYLDLEHSTCYNETNHWNALTNETNHWNALTDGLIKYVHRD